MKDCEFCRGRFSDTVVKEYKYWKVQLFLNQYYLGRCLVKLKEHKVDITELDGAERTELFERVLPELKKALDSVFGPDLYNYATLGKDCRQFHMHVIPRYSGKVEFDGESFRDENWNSHYVPYSEDFEIPDSTFEKIKERIGEKL